MGINVSISPRLTGITRTGEVIRNITIPIQRTMARMNASGEATLSLKCTDELIERADEAAEMSEHSSRSEFVRQAIAEKADETLGAEAGDQSDLSDRHQRALVLLRENTYPSGKLPTDEARSILSRNMGVKKERIKKSILEPLEEAGAIEPFWGNIRVIEE